MRADPPVILGILAWADRLIRRHVDMGGCEGRWVVQCRHDGGVWISTCNTFADARAECGRALLTAFTDREGGSTEEKMSEAEKAVSIYRADPVLMTWRKA